MSNLFQLEEKAKRKNFLLICFHFKWKQSADIMYGVMVTCVLLAYNVYGSHTYFSQSSSLKHPACTWLTYLPVGMLTILPLDQNNSGVLEEA